MMNKFLIKIFDNIRKNHNDNEPEIKVEERIPRIYKVHGGWGHHVEFLDFKSREVTGHLPIKPQVGDILTAEMKSGKIAVFRFIEVDYKHDPPDMFFGNVEDVGYADDETGKEVLDKAQEVEKSMFL